MARVEVRSLSMRFGSVLAVDDLSFDVEAGRVTGFLAFVAEPTLLALAPNVGHFGPTVGAPTGITAVSFDGGTDDPDLLSTPVAILVMLGWISLGFAATAALLRRRDLV